jgi:hypothetical protein|tara:strand:- start:1156 stop:2028 length:873 start_codon:yes stop_codon:yes gene_type:complete
MKKYIYLHVCCINNWRDVVGNMYRQIRESGLYEKIDGIRCSVLGDCSEFLEFIHGLDRDRKTTVVFTSSDRKYLSSNYRLISDGFRDDESRPIHNEEIILHRLHEDAQKEDFYVLYLHSKGVKRIKELPHQNSKVEDWVNLMLYFNLFKHEYMWEKLEEFDAVGINIECKPHISRHKKSCVSYEKREGFDYNIRFSGNFWWSKSTFIREMHRELGRDYGGPENWLTNAENARFLSVWNSYTDHYQNPYPLATYQDQGFHHIVINKVGLEIKDNDLKPRESRVEYPPRISN